MEVNKLHLNTLNLNRVAINTVGSISVAKGEQPPEPDITDALLMEDGSLFLMEDGSYFRLESVEVATEAKKTPTIDKSMWDF